ncbi:UNVERIFIED_CONTAM: exonuclease SbcD [Brevibacillus sp. OAP136]
MPKEAPFCTGPDTPAEQVRILQGGPSWFELAVPSVAHTAVIIALPYPSEARLRELISESFSQEQMQLAFSERIRHLLADLSGHFRTDTVNLIMSHMFVMGGNESDSERPIQIGGTHSVSLSAFPEQADYVALGHLHRLQKLSDKPLVRYSGSPLGYSFSEAGQSKAVVMLDLVPGEAPVEEIIYLQSSKPLARWKATEGIEQVEQWLAEGRDAEAWIELELHVSDTIDPAEFQRLKKMSDQFLKIQRVAVQAEVSSEETEETRQERAQMSPEQLFRRFYERKKGMQPDEKLIQLFSRLMVNEQADEGGGLA